LHLINVKDISEFTLEACYVTSKTFCG